MQGAPNFVSRIAATLINQNETYHSGLQGQIVNTPNRYCFFLDFFVIRECKVKLTYYPEIDDLRTSTTNTEII